MAFHQLFNQYKTIGLCVLLVFSTGCSSVPMQSPSDLIGYTETGQASFYAWKYQGRKTASGERFNQYAKTAAHRALPFGTKVKVTNTKNGKTVVVKINDRGPFVKGRVIDLSSSAFSAIGDTNAGVIPVKIQVVK